MATLNLTLRGAGAGDEKRLWDFYQSTLTDTLPVPSVTTIRKALQRGSLLIGEDTDSGVIVATAGYFEYIKSIDGHIVFELAGTRVTMGKLLPFSLQQIFLALRLFQIVVTEDQIKRQISVVSSARHRRSKENLVCIGMAEIDTMPRWMDYDTYSWAPAEHKDWRHYVADCACVDRALVILQHVGFEAGRHQCRCVRKKKDGTSEQIDVALTYQLPIAALLASCVQARTQDESICGLSSLPEAV